MKSKDDGWVSEDQKTTGIERSENGKSLLLQDQKENDIKLATPTSGVSFQRDIKSFKTKTELQ